MYIPAAFLETDAEKLCAFIQEYSFGLLVSEHAGAPFATHLPLLLDRTAGPQGCLIGHLARANPQWQEADGKTFLAVFSGPHAYISPAWYQAEQVVPTWNYAAVHAYGVMRTIHDPDALFQIVGQYVDFFESTMNVPWKFDASGEFAQKMIAGIVGFRIEITRLEGKWKLSQNQPRERREKVVHALTTRSDEGSQAIAELMRNSLARDRDADRGA